ncbi:MAG TPA: hypothetical protein VHV08_10235 [Pirellulales bacterium]|nr:hypothetical protein [Pirellulales bacterium]
MRQEDEFSPVDSHWLVRAYYTPLSDALHGRLSARLDARSEIAAAGLPMRLAALVLDVVRDTRLWRREKIDVARELAAHFSDGLAAGRTAEELIRDFGPATAAAKLIREAKRRNRPLVWQCWHLLIILAAWAMLVALIGYVTITTRFYFGRPTVDRNYWQEINAARHVDESDRAWPIYRRALLLIGQQDAWRIDPKLLEGGPGSENWRLVMELIERHGDAVDLVRQGAARPRMGYYLGDQGDIDATRAAQGMWLMSETMPLAGQNQELISAHLTGPQYARVLARLLWVDARLAAADDEGPRVLADLTALVSLSEQLHEPRATAVEQLIGMAIFDVTMELIGQILFEAPTVLDNRQLVALVHCLNSHRDGSASVDFTAERLTFDDVLQRAYTNDGHGNGRVTPHGMKLLANYAAAAESITHLCDPTFRGDRLTMAASRVFSPGVAFLIGSREENRQFYTSIMDEMIALYQGPAWQWDAEAIDAAERRLKDGISGMGRLRHCVAELLWPAVEAIYTAAERSAQAQEAAEAIIALRLWKNQHGTWPERLDELVPQYLPAVPRDRVDGHELRYVVRDGQAIVYSLGRDRHDDGGRACKNPASATVYNYATRQPNLADDDGPCDLIFWPPIAKTSD